MILRLEHGEILLQLLQASKPVPVETLEPQPALYELHLAGIVRQDDPNCWILTDQGGELALALDQLIEPPDNHQWSTASHDDDEKTILEKPVLPAPKEWSADFRLLGSEVIDLLDAARRGGRVGPEGQQPLWARGLAQHVRYTKRKRERIELTAEAQQILAVYKAVKPRLEIDSGLAAIIRKLPLGPTESSHMELEAYDRHRLENMRLLSYSQPDSRFAAFTALGQAVKRALNTGGFAPEGTVLSEDILHAIDEIGQGKNIPASRLAVVQQLCYVGSAGELLPAGREALEVLRLYRDGPDRTTWSFSIDADEAEILQTVEALWEETQENPDRVPTFDQLRHEMVDRKSKQYRELIKWYGRELKEMPEKQRKLAEKYDAAANKRQWYEENFDLRAMLHSLESFDLIRSEEDEKNRTVFHLTESGTKVKRDQDRGLRTVSSRAVKAITLTNKEFSTAHSDWISESKQAGLLGSFEATDAGQMYASLAYNVFRTPYLSHYELLVLQAAPDYGWNEQDLIDNMTGEMNREWTRWALDRLESRELLERLVDGNIVKTKPGILMGHALSGVPKGMGMPINPSIYRVVKGMAAAGTIYSTEKKVRVSSDGLAQAVQESGLAPEQFERSAQAARAAGFIGENSVNEAGQKLLEAVEHLQRAASQDSYHA